MLSTKCLLLVLIVGVVLSKAINLDKQAIEAKPIIVPTKNGLIKGSYGERSSGDNKTLYWFKGIPFAEPPVGDLRFEAPVPKEKWDGILDVRDGKPECIQASNPPTGSEDCLYLSVYSETKPSILKNLPVMVWIYGGAFFGGAADFGDHCVDYLLHEGVIVVGIHYRVGILGFLSTGDEETSANNGIRDQILALKWVKENIRHFGGDPNRITIFGQSAGAASVSYLLQIEETKGLFHKAIIQSGSSLSPWSLGKYVPSFVKDVAKDLKISTKNSREMVEALKKVDCYELQNAAHSQMVKKLVVNNPLQGLALGPVLEPPHERAIITNKSHELISNGQFHQIPILIGYTSLEISFPKLPAVLKIWLSRYDLDPSQLVPDDMNLGFVTKRLLGPILRTKYYGILPLALADKQTMRLFSDSQFEKPIVEAIHQYSKYTKVYAYHFSYQGIMSGDYNHTNDGVAHSEDLNYLFDFGLPGDEADYLTRNRVVRLWTNFAKTGNPTPKQDKLLQNLIWTPNEGSEDLKFLEIDKDLSLVSLPNADKLKYWRKIYNGYGRPPFSTY